MNEYPGVYWHKRKKMWRTTVKSHGRTRIVGDFLTQEAAQGAYINATAHWRKRQEKTPDGDCAQLTTGNVG